MLTWVCRRFPNCNCPVHHRIRRSPIHPVPRRGQPHQLASLLRLTTYIRQGYPSEGGALSKMSRKGKGQGRCRGCMGAQRSLDGHHQSGQQLHVTIPGLTLHGEVRCHLMRIPTRHPWRSRTFQGRGTRSRAWHRLPSARRIPTPECHRSHQPITTNLIINIIPQRRPHPGIPPTTVTGPHLQRLRLLQHRLHQLPTTMAARMTALLTWPTPGRSRRITSRPIL